MVAELKAPRTSYPDTTALIHTSRQPEQSEAASHPAAHGRCSHLKKCPHSSQYGQTKL